MEEQVIWREFTLIIPRELMDLLDQDEDLAFCSLDVDIRTGEATVTIHDRRNHRIDMWDGNMEHGRFRLRLVTER